MTSISYKPCILRERPSIYRTSRLLPISQSLNNLVITNIHAQRIAFSRDGDDVSIFDNSNRSPNRRFRHHMPNNKPMTSTAISPIRNKRHVREACAHNGSRGLELLWHTWPANWAFITHYQDEVFTMGDTSRVQGFVQELFFIEDHCFAGESKTFLAGDFGD